MDALQQVFRIVEKIFGQTDSRLDALSAHLCLGTLDQSLHYDGVMNTDLD